MGYQQERRDRSALLDVAVRAAREAATVIREAAPRARALDWHSKGPADFVSEVDLAAEERILAIVRRELPDAVVLAEETAAAVPAARLTAGLAVVVDPLDGTTNFLHGYPEYAVSIAILERGEPVAAVSTITDPQRALVREAGGLAGNPTMHAWLGRAVRG